ncbi:putative transcription factor interactor and regulator CCHC(Zn) family [Helianthus anomalus]
MLMHVKRMLINIIAFANIEEVNENLRDKILKDELQLEKTVKELKNKLYEKENEICSLKHEHNITKDQLQTMVEKYQVCKKDLESTQITCEKWVESSKGYELMLEKHVKSNVKFGIGFKKNDQTKNTAKTDSNLVEVIPKNKDGQEIKIVDKNGNKIILEKPEGSSTFEEIEKYPFKPTWSDECDILENFKPMDFSTIEGVKTPKAKVIPLKDIPTKVKNYVEKEKEKRKRREKIKHLFCDFYEKRNHSAKDCFHLKAFDINKTSINEFAPLCTICGKTNHLTHECVYLKTFEVKRKEYTSKTLESPSKPFIKNKQPFVPVKTTVTKQLNKTAAPREVQVTDAPPSN